VEVRRKGDRILLVKLILGREIFNVISVCAPQVGLDESSKRQFWEDLDEIVQCIPIREKLFIGGDLSGHVGTSRYGFDSVHRGFNFGKRNEPGNSILDFALSYDFILANTWFRKRESHLITFRSGSSVSQIDFFLTRKVDRGYCMDCKVVPGESVVTQHKLLILDVQVRRRFRKIKRKLDPKIKVAKRR